MSYIIAILRIPISQNSSEWRNDWRRRDYKGKWKMEAWVLLKSQQVMPMERVRLSAVVYFPDKRKRDFDNYIPTVWKPVQDAIVDAGIIPDDNTKYIPESPTIRFAYDRDFPRTEITITEIGPE